MQDVKDIKDYFRSCFSAHGEDPVGVDWNSPYAQETRFDQVLKVIQQDTPFTILDFGCGYGAEAEYMLRKGFPFSHYYGYDIVPEAVESAKKRFRNNQKASFYTNLDEIPPSDYLTASGVFNIKLDHSKEEWTEHVLNTLQIFNQKTTRGFASNFLTSYSDPPRMAERPDLYFADPCQLFDYCRRNFSRNVALLHDYKIWDFTIIVRKEFD